MENNWKQNKTEIIKRIEETIEINSKEQIK